MILTSNSLAFPGSSESNAKYLIAKCSFTYLPDLSWNACEVRVRIGDKCSLEAVLERRVVL